MPFWDFLLRCPRRRVASAQLKEQKLFEIEQEEDDKVGFDFVPVAAAAIVTTFFGFESW